MKGNIITEIDETALFIAIEKANVEHCRSCKIDERVLFRDSAIIKAAELICEEQRSNNAGKQLFFNPNAYTYCNSEKDFEDLKKTIWKDYFFMFVAIDNEGYVSSNFKPSECKGEASYNYNLKEALSDSNVASIIICDRYLIPDHDANVFVRIYYNENYLQNKKNREAVMQVKEVTENMMANEKFEFQDTNEKKMMNATKCNLQASTMIELPEIAISTVEENLKKTFDYLTKLMSDDNDKYDFEELSRKSIDDIVDTINNAGLKLIHRIAFVGLNYDITKLFSNDNIIAYGFSGYDNNANPLLRIEEITRDIPRYPIDTKEFIKSTIECTEDKSSQWYVVYVLYTDADGTITLTFTIY